jgi:hypothetical protein
MIDVNKEAEEYAKKQCDDMYNHIGLTGAEWGWETKLDFIAGHNSKATQAKILQAKIEILEGVDGEYYYSKPIYIMIEELKQQLKELEND